MGDDRSHVRASVQENPSPWFQQAALDHRRRNTKLLDSSTSADLPTGQASVKMDDDHLHDDGKAYLI